jgi:hypothetical protein
MSYSIGGVSQDIMGSMRGAMLMFMIFPALVQLFFIIALFSPTASSSNFAEPEIFAPYMLYLMFAIAGAMLGAVGFFIAGFTI